MMGFNIFNSDVDVVIGNKNFYTFKEAAEIINHKDLGQKRLFKLLREKDILNKYNEPMEEWLNNGFFKVVNNKYATTLISSYGINYIKKHLL